MKDIKYFLDAERKFQEEHPQEHELYYDPDFVCLMPRTYPDDFLRDGWMHKIAEGPYSKEIEEAKKKYNLSDVEVLIMYCFYGKLSRYFRDDIYYQYGQVPEIAKEMQIVLESFIKKAPKHKEGVLYRFLKPNDKVDVCVGEVFEPPCSLTTTNEDWNQDKDVYVITTLPEKTTSAYDIFKIYNHGDENQVNFLKGTRFEVTKIDSMQNGYKRIYLKEL